MIFDHASFDVVKNENNLNEIENLFFLIRDKLINYWIFKNLNDHFMNNIKLSNA